MFYIITIKTIKRNTLYKNRPLLIAIEARCLVWFGHSSYYMQLDSKRILVDHVLSGSDPPLTGGRKACKG